MVQLFAVTQAGYSRSSTAMLCYSLVCYWWHKVSTWLQQRWNFTIHDGSYNEGAAAAENLSTAAAQSCVLASLFEQLHSNNG